MIGTSLGPYTILESLGVGGMGEVFLAEDSRLGRKVAIKVLPEEFAADPERLARFEQEARASAALSNPHIAAVFDVGQARLGGESGTTVSTHFMVQEYLEGHTLRTTLAPGPLPLGQALGLATEIAKAVAAAHTVGIIHRDLKPENIFVTKDGHAKVLDFGLAKLTESSPLSGGDSAESPTKLGTVVGQVMGTAGYMAPEQAQGGEEIDSRADIFSFGCVFYEMVSGRRAFSGETLLDTLHAITRSEPEPLDVITADIPAELLRIVSKCLAKDPTRRYQHADDLAVDLRTLATGVESGVAMRSRTISVPDATAGDTATALTSMADGASGPDAIIPNTVGGAGASIQRRISLSMVANIALSAVVVGALLMWALAPKSGPQPVSRSIVQLGESQVLDGSGVNPFAISPDGGLIVYAGDVGGLRQLYLRRVDQFDATPIPGTEGASGPFFSPDGKWVGFFASGQLRKVAISGGQSQLVAETPWIARGASWGAGDTIVIGTAGPDGLYSVSAAGDGLPEILVPLEPGDSSLERPSFLPDGRSLLYVAEMSARADIRVFSADTGQSKTLGSGLAVRYVSPGYLLYAEILGNLMVVEFDSDTLETRGLPTSLDTQARVHVSGEVSFDVSASGSLIYLAWGSARRHSLLWVDRDGNMTPASAEKRAFSLPRISPDGRKAAIAVGAGTSETHVWILDLERDILTPLTSRGTNIVPVWSPDGEWVFFSSTREGSQGWDIFRKAASAGQRDPADIVLELVGFQVAADVSPDGRTLLLTEGGPQGDLTALPLDGSGTPEPLLMSEAVEGMPMISPDGSWVAFISNETGREEVYVRSLVGSGPVIQVSRAGGSSPTWARDGLELYYRRGAEVIAVEVETEPVFRPLSERSLFEVDDIKTVGREYDVGPDGRFLMILDEDPAATSSFRLVLNWADDLAQRLQMAGR